MKLGATVAALAVAIGVLAVAPASATEPVTSVRESFTEVEDGPAPDTIVDTTTPVTNYQGNSGAAPYVRGGFLSTADPDTAVGGAYRIAHLDNDATTIGATFAFSPYSARGGVLCLSIQADSIASSPSVPVSPLHFVISPTDWGLDVNTEAGTGVEGMVGGEFDKPLASDGKTLHTVELTLDRSTSKVRLTLPDGTTRTFANPAFGLPGSHVYVEPFKSPQAGPLAEQPNALVSEWWADSAPVNVTEDAVMVPKPKAEEPVVIAEVEPSPVIVQQTPAPVVVQTVAPEAPRDVRATRHGVKVITKWRASTVVRVKCGKVSKVIDGRRVALRSSADRCKVRAITAAGVSPWVVTRVR